MVDEKVLRSELVKQPRPAKIIVHTEDGESKEVAGAGKNGVTWASVARTIMALDPRMVELFDAQGTLLRAVNAAQSTLELAATAPGGGVAGYSIANLHADPETARLIHFANLLSDAHRFATGTAFQRIVEIVQIHSDRATALEQRLERAEATHRRNMQERIDEVFEEAEEMRAAAARGDEAGARNIFESFMEGMMGGRRDAHANGSNGASKS